MKGITRKHNNAYVMKDDVVCHCLSSTHYITRSTREESHRKELGISTIKQRKDTVQKVCQQATPRKIPLFLFPNYSRP